MDTSLLAGVSGLQAHQRMLDVTGNNLANVNTTAYKSSRVSFSELLGNTLKEASQPTSSMGGTNPMQIGAGVQVASIDRNMTQGSLMNTGQPLDMAVDGSGFFVLNDGKRDIYTRVGAFAVDSNYYLVDPGTGYRVQRIGTEGMSNGFQSVSNNDIRIPFDVALPARATSNLFYTGNLSADQIELTQNVMTSGIQYSTAGSLASADTTFSSLDQTANLAVGDKLVISGTKADGTAIAATDFDLFDGDGNVKTMGDLISEINTLFPGSTATIVNGEIRLTDNELGYSRTDVKLTFDSAGASTFKTPSYFTMLSAGGQASKSTNVDIYDTQGIAHSLSATFVKSTEANKWDLVLTSVSGDVTVDKRRISGITFLSDGSFSGLSDADPTFKFKFVHEPNNIRSVSVHMGTSGEFDGLGQLGGTSTVAPSGQDGYMAGSLSSLSVNREGVLVGVFTNGIRADVAAVKLATFQNSAGLASIGNNYFSTSANSGDAVASRALSGAAGSIRGGALEKSNVEVATEFVNLIEAQNGFQANARTIKVATDMVRELTNLIR